MLTTPWFDGIADSVADTEDGIPFLIECFDRWNNGKNLNFADYVFLRKANLAWKECSSESALSSRNMDCALQITNPGKILSTVEAK